MSDEPVLRDQARTAMHSGRLPSCSPERMWGGPGSGVCCAVCGQALKQDELEIELQFPAGDQGALHALYERMHRIVFTLIMRITHNREIAEEVTLDVFHDVWRRASKYDDAAGGSVVGWIMNQARSRAIDRVRFEHRKKRVAPEADEPIQALEAHDAGQVLEEIEQGRILREALTVLTPDERQLIETAYFSELTYAGVAVRLNQPLGTVKTRIRSGLAKLRQTLLTEKRKP